MLSSVIGHESVSEFFRRARTQGRLAHAYAFVGPDSIGKRTLARALGAELLGVPTERLSTHPDFFSLEQEKNEKTGKTKKNIDVDQVRDLRSALSLRPFVATNKIAIIDEAEKMNESAANALLKTLEEPASYTLLFLITTSERALPDTIRSRCQMLYFYPVDQTLIAAHLEQMGQSAADSKRLARLSLGRPGRAITWATDAPAFTEYEKEVNRFCELPGKALYEKIALTDDLFGDKTDNVAARERLAGVLDLWEILTRDFFFHTHTYTERLIHRLPATTVWGASLVEKVTTAIETARIGLRRNLHPRLLVEHILLELP